MLQWGFNQLTTFLGLVFSFFVLPRIGPWLDRFQLGFLSDWASADWFFWLEVVASVGFVLSFVSGLLFLRLDYLMRWYMLSDRALRIREGTLRLREQTMTFANIQNIKIHQGPLERLFGVANLEVHTAGGGDVIAEDGEGQHLHRGVLKGIEDAHGLRDRMRQLVAQYRDAGLGDPGDRSADPVVVDSGTGRLGDAGLVVALRGLTGEIRGLRGDLLGSSGTD